MGASGAWVVPIVLALVACAGGPGAAQRAAIVPEAIAADTSSALDRVEFTAALAAHQPVLIDNPYGDIRLRFGGYDPLIEIHGVRQQPEHAAPMRFQPGAEDGVFTIAPRLPDGELLAPGQRIDLVVFVPAGHPVQARTEQGLIEARGIRADIELISVGGNIAVRGITGSIQARTGGAGAVEAALEAAPPGSTQQFETRTGALVLAVGDDLDARVHMATSAPFATEYSLDVSHRPGQEPNKEGLAVIGEPRADVRLESRRGEIRLLRRGQYVPAAAEGLESSGPREGAMKNAQAP